VAGVVIVGGGIAGVSVAYAVDADPEYYGVALVVSGLVCGFGGRTWMPSWIDTNARDQTAAMAVTAGWLPFEGVYGDHLQVGAGTHLAAALFYAFAAVIDRSELTLDLLLDLGARVAVRVGAAWLYASGLTLGIGYVYLLRGLPAAEGAEASSLALPLMALSLGFLAAGGLLRWWRPDLRVHLYRVAQVATVMVVVSGIYRLVNDAMAIAGTLSLGGPAFRQAVVELVRSADVFAGVVLVCAHGGNAEPLADALRTLRDEGRRVLAWSPSIAGGDAHAGRTETSVLLALRPDAVALDQAETGDVRPIDAILPQLRDGGVQSVSPNGVLGDPSGASAAEGATLLAALADDLVASVAGWAA